MKNCCANWELESNGNTCECKTKASQRKGEKSNLLIEVLTAFRDALLREIAAIENNHGN